jgi:hypothetical protein
MRTTFLSQLRRVVHWRARRALQQRLEAYQRLDPDAAYRNLERRLRRTVSIGQTLVP